MNMVPFLTLLKREVLRFLVIIHNTLSPVIISALLYFLVFGAAIGGRIGQIEGKSYLEFIVPGLVMMQTIFTTYSSTSFSLFMARRFETIKDVLASPMSYTQIVLAYVLSGVIRGIFVALSIVILALIFVKISIFSIGWVIFYVLAVNFIFASLGIIFGLITDEFENIGLLTTFFLTPLTFLGGVFYSIKMLPDVFQRISQYNPILYMVDGLRYGMIGIHDTNLTLNLIVVSSLGIILFLAATLMFKSGYKLKE